MVTIKDVAKYAGVSVGTVSKVINNIEVKPKTKIAVDNAIKELNYEPNIYARGLKVNKTNTVAFILPSVWDPFYSELAFNIEINLRKFDLKMLLCNSQDNYASELEYITMAKQNKVDGIISITYSDIDKYVSSNIPLISIDRYFTEDITYVSSDNFNGGEIAAEELVKAGCRNIAFIGSGSKIDNTTRNRKKGFINYCNKNNINYKIYDAIEREEHFENALNSLIEDNLCGEIKIDGIFAITDRHAIEIINRLEELNIKVPEQVQVIGFDGIRSSIHDEIKISTIRQPIELVAKEAVKALINLLQNKPIKKEILLPVKFIKGYTTK